VALSALIAAFLAGLVGSSHCLAMCGGYVAAVASSRPQRATLAPLRHLAIVHAASHAGRLVTYAALGAAAASIGTLAGSTTLAALQQALYVLASLVLLVIAFAIARSRGTPFAVLERAGLALHAGASRLIGPSARTASSPLVRGAALGLLWGLTPCTLVYAVLPVAMLSSSPASGALVMLSFGLGTLPALLASGALGARYRAVLAGGRARTVLAALVGGFGAVGLYRALFDFDALSAGALCLVR
jgi:sulfite exporter TauE/SafE